MGNAASRSVGQLQIKVASSCTSTLEELQQQPEDCANVVSVSSFAVKDANLVHFPVEAFQFHFLQSLDLSNNQITCIPTQISTLKSLKKLVLMHNAIRTLPEALCSLKNLTFLEVSYNSLIEVPTFLGKCTKLTGLGLSANQITSFPNELCALLPELVQLGVHSNQIAQLPTNLHLMKNLKKFDACRNLIHQIPEGFCELESLEWCNLSHNRIQELPLGMHKLQNLHEIGLAHNQITCIRPLKGLHNLTSLIIYDNKIRLLCGDTVASLRQLQVLEVGHNEIETVPFELWDLQSLKRINLQYNSIHQVQTRQFSYHSGIVSLMLQGNRIEYLPVELISIITSCQTFSLAYNPWLRQVPERRVLSISLREASLNALLNSSKQPNSFPKTCRKAIDNAKRCMHCKLARTSEMHPFFRFYSFSQFGAVPFVGYTCCQ